MEKNLLKDLIYIQENKPCNEQTLKSLFRAILEPLLENPTDGVVLHRLIDTNGLIGLLKRLEFIDNVEAFDMSDNAGLVKQKIWDDTQFLIILTHRYGVALIWDYSTTGTKDKAGYYTIFNSKILQDVIDIINPNSKKDFSDYKEKYKPDRRENLLLNKSLCRIIDLFGETAAEAVTEKISDLPLAEAQAEKLECLNSRTRVVAHEIRNQLSICDLYLSIIKKYSQNNGLQYNTIDNAVNCMTKAIKIAGNCLIDLKSVNSNDLKPHNLKDLVNSVVNLTSAYFDGKDIMLKVKNDTDLEVLVDENKFSSVLINLIKNATEAFDSEQKNKFIKIKTDKKEGFAKVSISNNGKKISEVEKIFEEGFTTKKEGSGLGLGICKRSMEEQFGKIELIKSDDISTDFEVTASIV